METRENIKTNSNNYSNHSIFFETRDIYRAYKYVLTQKKIEIIMIFWRIWESFEICHGDNYVGAWGHEHLLVPHHVEDVVEVVWD
jgi:hypothetical protein